MMLKKNFSPKFQRKLVAWKRLSEIYSFGTSVYSVSCSMFHVLDNLGKIKIIILFIFLIKRAKNKSTGKTKVKVVDRLCNILSEEKA